MSLLKIFNFKNCVLACTLIFTHFAYATTIKATNPNDPYENYNRHAYQLNKTLDKIIFKPVAQTYQFILPKPATKGVSNFFSNLAMMPTVANDILQGDLHNTLSDTWRFFFNSTIGVGGLFDVASYMGLPPHSEDFGLTLAKWGFSQSSYFIIPILGPSTIRDTIGIPVDYELFTIYPYMQSVALRNSLLGLDFVSHRAQLLRFDDVLQTAALDQYSFERDAYLQHRASRIRENSGKMSEDQYITAEPHANADDIYLTDASLKESNTSKKPAAKKEDEDLYVPE